MIRGFIKMIALVLFALGVMIFIYGAISILFDRKIYQSTEAIGHKRAALLLGTAKYIAKGRINYFYKYRIDAAVELWRAKKIDAIIVSGDNGDRYYDETTKMYNDLKKAGVPSRYIFRDDYGFRTLDSVVRAKRIFGVDDIVIISQRFHLQRALLIAHAKGIKAIGFAAADKMWTKAAFKMTIRESLARIKALMDIYLFDTQPKRLGKKQSLHYRR